MSEKTETKEARATILQPRILIWLILAQFLVQLGTFLYLYLYVAKVESEFRAAGSIDCIDRLLDDNEAVRRKRSNSLPITEDNAVLEVFKAREEKELPKAFKKVTASPIDVSDGEVPATGATGQDWIWLTADTRIPFDAIDSFCRWSRDYCPRAPPGAPGPPGDRGLPGHPGSSGPEGPPGLPGYPGERGQKGEAGIRGLDGRDGVPGEPGLDGVPGRSGLDGLPGINGMPGLNGTPGLPGRNGSDGKPGLRGPAGPRGPPGPRGANGPRGKPGQDGKPGIPGVVAWKIKTNDSSGSNANGLLLPPSILVSGDERSNRSIVVEEGANVRLRCVASGNPRPVIQWSRADARAIPLGSWHASSETGHTLNITVVNREHMGDYVCTANNGIPPSATQRFKLQVQFPPFIRIRNQVVRARHQGTATLECEVEAFPEPVTYWQRGDGRILELSDKYRMDVYDRRDIYKLKMRLNVTRINLTDHGQYHCVAKNVIDVTKGTLKLNEKSSEGTKKMDDRQEVVFGARAPAMTDLDELCPPQPSCDACPSLRCAFSDFGGRLDVRPLAENINYTGLPPRVAEGVLAAVGKPVFKGSMDDHYGAWMHDASPRSKAAAEKLWVTRKKNSSYIFEYNRKEDYDLNRPRVIRLPYPFKGNGHVVYNGSFFYNPEGRDSIVRFDLPNVQGIGSSTSTRETELRLPGLLVNTSNYLYTPGHNFNYVDFDVDENGLWVIYGLPSNNTVVTKVDAVSMRPQYAWNISVNHHKLGEMFIAYGVLYAVHSVTDKTMNIRLALDLYKNVLLDVSLSFSNPFRKTTMVGYNHRNKELYTWDKGSQLAYPVKYHETSYNVSREDAKEMDGIAEVLTGYDVSNNMSHYNPRSSSESDGSH